MKPIRKAVFPVAGLGTRFLPATKAMPKEMLPVVDRPLIQYAFEEARAAGIEQFIFVTGHGKSILEDHFDRAYELEDVLAGKRKMAELEAVSGWLPAPGELSYTRQPEALGLGHAVWCARHLVGDDPFAVLLVDDSKLGARGQNAIAKVTEVSTVLASAAPQSALEPLRATGVNLRVVEGG